MYDAKQELHEFVADDREAAVAKACAFFGLESDALQIEEPAAGDVYGLGGRTVVVAGPKDRKPPAPRGPRDGGEGRGRDREGRGGRDRGGRERRERGGRDRGGRDAAPAPVLSDEPSVGKVQGELGEIGKYVCGAIERLEVGPFEISESQEGDVTAVEVKGAAAAVLAAGEARAIDALQLLANQALARIQDEGRVVLDIEGASESREKHLERLAERAVKRAKEGGKAIALDPMNGHDRRAIHLAVKELDSVATMSIGEGRYRQVVVVPEGADEYEEALRQSEGS
ncbi:MAG: R3H domain-containing nucleic acid-binding protein [Myxococcota bacterium]